MQHYGFQMAALASTVLDMCQKPQKQLKWILPNVGCIGAISCLVVPLSAWRPEADSGCCSGLSTESDGHSIYFHFWHHWTCNMLSNEWTVELSTYNHRTPRKSEKRSVMCLVENNFARVMTSLFSISKIGAVCCRRCQEQLSYFAVIPKGCCCSLRLSRGMPACSSAELELNFPGNFPSSYQSPLSCSTFLLSPFYTV